MNRIRLYKDSIDILECIANVCKIIDSLHFVKDSKSARSTTTGSKGTVIEKETTLRYNNVPTSKWGRVKEDWTGSFNNGMFTLIKKGDKSGKAYSIPIRTLYSLIENEKERKKAEKEMASHRNPYDIPVGGTIEEDIANYNYYISDPYNNPDTLRNQRTLSQSLGDMAKLLEQIGILVGTLAAVKQGVFVKPVVNALGKLKQSRELVRAASNEVSNAQNTFKTQMNRPMRNSRSNNSRRYTNRGSLYRR